MDIKTALADARALLQQKNIDLPRLEAEVLLAHTLNCSRAALYAHAGRELPPEAVQKFNNLVEKRAGGMPTAYLTGKKEFMGLEFKVNPAVLIPRPDTELLVETAVHLLRHNDADQPLMIDVGTGSGAIAVSTACFVPRLKVQAIDVSPEALAVAKENAALHGVSGRVHFLEGNLLEPLLNSAAPGTVDLIAANLPYVPSEDIPGLAAEVRREPLLALDGGLDGLDLYRLLIPQAEKLLKPGGHLLMEIGPGQGQKTLNLLDASRWQSKLYRDLAERERLVAAVKC